MQATSEHHDGVDPGDELGRIVVLLPQWQIQQLNRLSKPGTPRSSVIRNLLAEALGGE